MEFFIRPALFLIPLYLANSMPAVFGGKTPIDLNSRFVDKRRLLGKGKTFRGTIAGILIGSAGAMVVWVLFGAQTEPFISSYWLAGIAISLGAVVGDLVKSFFKRRAGIESGKPWPLVDQLDFVAGGYVFALPFFVPTLPELAFVVLFTLFWHVAGNILAFRLKIKRVPW